MNKGKLRAVFFLLVIVVIAFIGIRVLNGMKKKVDVNDTILKAVENTNWPVEDVPLISKDNLVVNNLGEYNCEARVSSGGTYEELRKYLIKLYDVGFKPYEDMGSVNPNRMISASSAEDINEVSWMGQKDNYTINVLWAKDGAVDDFGIEFGFNLDINLFINPGNTDSSMLDENKLNNQDLEVIEENIDSVELEVSGNEVNEVIINTEEQTRESEQIEGENNE